MSRIHQVRRHRWRVSPRAAIEIQRRLATLVSVRRAPRIRRIVGVDCAFGPDRVWAVAVCWDLAAGKLVEVRAAHGPLTFAYVPGLLSFREVPALLKVLKRLTGPFEAIMCDGQGIAHPRRFGLACHLGVLLEVPTIGCAKSRLIGTYDEPAAERGSCTWLIDRGERIGSVVRTRSGVSPLFVSPGHRVGFADAERLVLAASRFRVPEPTRHADQWVARYKAGERVAFKVRK